MKDEKYEDYEKMVDLATQIQESLAVLKQMTATAKQHTERAEKLRQAINLQKEGSPTYQKMLNNIAATISKAKLMTNLVVMVSDYRDQLQKQLDEIKSKYPELR